MGISTKFSGNHHRSSSATEKSWAMGFLLVFFSDEYATPNKLLPRSSGNCSNLSPSSSFHRRRSSSSGRILTKAQSTISICAILVFLTLLVFTRSTFEPTSTPITSPRRLLSQAAGARPSNAFRFSNLCRRANYTQIGTPKHQFALQGMGTLYRRGTRAMNDLVVAHVTESATEDELRLFLRAIHRSGLTVRADLALILCSKSPSFDSVIREENDAFSRLLLRYGELNGTNFLRPTRSWGNFDATHFIKPVRSKEKEVAEPLWGKRTRSNCSDGDGDGGLTRVNYGSVLSFQVAELDPENSLAGFLDHVPMSLRRWGCYQMLLGRVRRSFKHVMLVDVRTTAVLGDPLGQVRTRSPESVYLVNGGGPPRHGKKIHGQTSVNAGMIMGGARGVRRLAAAMLAEIVWAAMQHRKKSSVTESAVLSQLAGNEHLLRNVEVTRAQEPSSAAAGGPREDFVFIQGGNGLGDVIMTQICLCEIDSSVYKNC